MNAYKKATTYKSEDNVDTMGIQQLLIDALKEIKSFDFCMGRVDKLEWQSRDGFIAHDHNRGGADYIAFTDIGSLVGNGYHIATKIEHFVNEEYNNACKEIEKEYPDIDEEKRYELIDEITNCEYNGLAWRIRLMYEGNGLLVVHSGWDKDAPYYRWKNETNLVQEIKFKNKTDLKAKLKKAIAKAIKEM